MVLGLLVASINPSKPFSYYSCYGTSSASKIGSFLDVNHQSTGLFAMVCVGVCTDKYPYVCIQHSVDTYKNA